MATATRDTRAQVLLRVQPGERESWRESARERGLNLTAYVRLAVEAQQLADLRERAERERLREELAA